MDGILAPGDKVRDDGSSEQYEIENMLGFGGQGEVYRARVSGRAVAVKWYFPESATDEQRSILANLIKSGSPDKRFLWPTSLVSMPGRPGFGYVMGLRDGRYGNISDLLSRKMNTTFRALATAGVHLADGFYRLHAFGLCYRDISHNNVFLDPHSGEVLICDNDNVGPSDSPIGIGGTMRYMAPEVVLGHTAPSAHTDLFSLAVLLFTILMNHHPLEGRREADIHCFDETAMRKIYGSDPLFIWDPGDTGNRPEPGYQDNAIIFWDIYPEFLKIIFTEAFTKGMTSTGERVTEGRWRRAMSRLRDAIFYCVGCGEQNIYDMDRIRAHNGDAGRCWSCHGPLQVPPRMRIGKGIVMLNHDARLFHHHIDDSKGYDFSASMAEVVQHPNRPMVWGLKNLSTEHWAAFPKDSTPQQVNPGQSVTLTSGTRVHIGGTECEIRV
ncbi:protein kinase-like protein [Nonomuraea fuscirosea]|uniref:Protein kinase-like protein n=1 Tax=Nonomuraea fuscirosea TaxID=1291556 RepID=A0A2T0M4V7_9ACTN|nr:protein kinase [Nonomuraea fuscirosea]PRX52254.1 protein kinase-like protein [Nonomuraea fuscirosea]